MKVKKYRVFKKVLVGEDFLTEVEARDFAANMGVMETDETTIVVEEYR